MQRLMRTSFRLPFRPSLVQLHRRLGRLNHVHGRSMCTTPTPTSTPTHCVVRAEQGTPMDKDTKPEPIVQHQPVGKTIKSSMKQILDNEAMCETVLFRAFIGCGIGAVVFRAPFLVVLPFVVYIVIGLCFWFPWSMLIVFLFMCVIISANRK